MFVGAVRHVMTCICSAGFLGNSIWSESPIPIRVGLLEGKTCVEIDLLKVEYMDSFPLGEKLGRNFTIRK